MSAGVSEDAAFAASMKDSLMILTVNSLVDNIFSRESFGRARDSWKEMLTKGGLCDTLGYTVISSRRDTWHAILTYHGKITTIRALN